MSILSRRFLGRARLFQELVEDWRTAPNHALFEREVGELIVEAKEIAAVAQAARDTIKKRLKERNPENIELEGAAMKRALGRIQAAMVDLEEVVENGLRRSKFVPESDSLPTAMAGIARIRDDLGRWFPPIDLEQIEAAVAEFKRGEHVAIEELIHAAQNQCAIPG